MVNGRKGGSEEETDGGSFDLRVEKVEDAGFFALPAPKTVDRGVPRSSEPEDRRTPPIFEEPRPLSSKKSHPPSRLLSDLRPILRRQRSKMGGGSSIFGVEDRRSKMGEDSSIFGSEDREGSSIRDPKIEDPPSSIFEAGRSKNIPHLRRTPLSSKKTHPSSKNNPHLRRTLTSSIFRPRRSKNPPSEPKIGSEIAIGPVVSPPHPRVFRPILRPFFAAEHLRWQALRSSGSKMEKD